MTTAEMTPEMSALKTRLKSTWESGDYGVFAKYLEKGALEFFDRLNIPAGSHLLDVACGAGQLTIPAARKGIKVTAVDLADNLVKQAQEKLAKENLEAIVVQGDAENLALDDSSFDTVMSLIGAMFAPRPELVASEMIRVCKPDGRIIMGNWTPEGHVGQMFKVIGKHVPPPSIFPSPLLWGNESKVRERLKDAKDIRITRYMYPMEYPFSPQKVAEFFIQYYGPTNKAYASLDDSGKKAFLNDLSELWARNNTANGGTTKVLAEYIEIVATKK